jgi:hypothetical protein
MFLKGEKLIIVECMSREGFESAAIFTEPTLREIDALLEGIAALSKEALQREDFYREFLQRVVGALGALGGVVWAREGSDGLRAAWRLGICAAEGNANPAGTGWHHVSAAWVLVNRTPQAALPGSPVAPDAASPNPTDCLLLFSPWAVEDESAGVVEIAQRPGASPGLQAGYLRFLEAACELLAEYERNALLRDMRHRDRHWARIETFARRIHASLDVVPTAYAIANEGLGILQCDRLSVLVRRGSKYKAVAVSGAESFSRRANPVRLMERLTAAALRAGEAVWYPADRECPPQIAGPLDAYLDESHARGLGIVPLRVADENEGSPKARILGGLVIERFFGPADEPLRHAAAALAAHSALALQNAMAVEKLPFARLLRKLGAIGGALRGRRLAACILVLAAVAAIVAALIQVEADFSVEARGELQPVVMRDIFAPDDAVVGELRAQSGARVAANQVVLTLRKPALELEQKRVWGELQTAKKKLAAVESEQLLNRREDETQRKRYTELTAQQEELRALLASLDSQHAILRQQQSELEVRSPIAGELVTWDAEQLLAVRPVARGQVLLTVADLAGPWHLELRIPERRLLHLAEARRDSGGPLDVSFALATNPAQVLQGTLDRVGGRTEITETEGAVVLAAASIDSEEIPERVPGASVVARIHCGQRALGYVWLHDLIDAVRTWVFF